MWMVPSDNNPAMGLAVHNGADMSIGTQSEEERMQRHQIMAISEYFDVLKSKKLWFQIGVSESDALINYEKVE